MAHTIVLVQFDNTSASRTYVDYETPDAAMDGICQLFERKLKQLNPTVHTINYDVSQLFQYIDSLNDMCCMVYNKKLQSYEPHNKEWIKSRVFSRLKGQA
eukprot:TRINITY_DN8763_c0_g1_i1.p1 TRINITY_DN8763_c0_g1~~TRINITY_DN8763_c0_g1_i1.p1  ORF type:complete len:100 (-),score=28.07 TRINITY_DN8763_c0_g1_i1:227-526(-)